MPPSPGARIPDSSAPQLSRSGSLFFGTPASPGVAIGTLFAPASACPLEEVPDRVPDDADDELCTLDFAMGALHQELREQGAEMVGRLPEEIHNLYGVYETILSDPHLLAELTRHIRSGLWAPAALRDTVRALVAQFEALDSANMRARAEDIRAVGRRLLRHLMACENPEEPPRRTLLLGEGLGLPCISAIPVERLAGLICVGGSPLSHAVIIAKALGIPAVVGVDGLHLVAGVGHREAILDGYRGRVILDPEPRIRAEYERLAGEERVLAADLAAERGLPTRTADGVEITLQANVALLSEITSAKGAGADGVGLYRSELLFLMRDEPPDEETQVSIYRELLDAFAPQPVTIRTLDVGSDKPLPYMYQAEPNPALGQRGIRLSLAHPELFLIQLRALLRANAGLGNLRLILPMVTAVSELREARALIEQARREVVGAGGDCVLPPVGSMVEVPAAVLRMDELAAEADFISVGTNDLTQYMLAADRTNPSLRGFCDPLTPAVLSAVDLAVQGARRRGISVGVCGEMAGEPLGALLLLGLGVDSLSLSAGGIPRVRRLVRSFSHQEARGLWERALGLESAQAVRALLRAAVDAKALGRLVGPEA